MSDNNKDFTMAVNARVKLFLELINDKNNQLNAMVENIKRLDGYVLGSKESVDKIEKHIKQQKVELNQLVSQNKLPKEVATLIDSALNSTLIFAKNICLDAERLFFSKQGEIVFLKQDIEKLNALKANHEGALSNAKKQEQVQEKQQPTPIEKVRPDKNPNTKIGKAAIDIMERKKRVMENVKAVKEDAAKKRGRKPKEN